MTQNNHYDVVILGGGLAGLSLARHLLLDTDKTVLLLERLSEIPPSRQKVGESSVQLAGYYFSKVLDLESYMFHEQFMKYNLRFYWKNAGRDNSRFEDYGHVSIRPFSNIASYQLNRNTFEAELLRRNRESERFTVKTSVSKIDVDLAEGSDPHHLCFQVGDDEVAVTAGWVVDTTGRVRLLANRRKLRKESTIRHGSFFWWVEGLVDIEKLTDRSQREIRLRPERSQIGHLPMFLATNHFMDEGLWFWVIPLQGKTSLGIVFDSAIVPHDDVFSVEKATRWVCERFPLFARDLPRRKVLDSSGLKRYSHDCEQTISASRWAMAGEAGRFTDPLYSPGSDLISIYNTLIVDAIKTSDPEELAAKCEIFEQLMRAVYLAYLPSYDTSYDVLGDQEAFALKYVWELSVYFAGYVFPFINDLFTDRRFLLGFMRHFSQLGPINRGVQQVLSDYYQWKKQAKEPTREPIFFDLMDVSTLREAEKTFYKVGVSVDEAKKVLGEQVANLEELARFIVAHVVAVMIDDERVMTNRRFLEEIDLRAVPYDLDALCRQYQEIAGTDASWEWSFDPAVLQRFRTESRAEAEAVRTAA